MRDPELEVLLARLDLKYAEIVASLPEREAMIWMLRYPRRGVGLTLEEIGNDYGLTRQRISQILKRIKRKHVHPGRLGSLIDHFVLVRKKASMIGINPQELSRIILSRNAGLRFHLAMIKYGLESESTENN